MNDDIIYREQGFSLQLDREFGKVFNFTAIPTIRDNSEFRFTLRWLVFYFDYEKSWYYKMKRKAMREIMYESTGFKREVI